MQITLPYVYTENRIPAGCRKARPVQCSAEITVTIPEVKFGDAPVAIVEHGHAVKERNGQSGYVRQDTVYRYWRGQLWVRASFTRYSHGPSERQTARQFVEDPYPYRLDRNQSDGYDSRSEQRSRIMRWARSLLFINGQRWRLADEPRYVIMTFGLGHNHGLGWGTTLSEDCYYNPNITRDRYYRIDQYEAALKEATRIAAARGDTNSLPIEKQKPARFEILIPAVVKLNPQREHGKGNAFINSLEGMIEGSTSVGAAAAGAFALAAAKLA